jgi:hypothetical protein
MDHCIASLLSSSALILSFLIFAILGLQAVRFASWFGMVLAPVVAEHLAATLAQAGASWTSLWQPRSVSESAQGEVISGKSSSRRRTYLVLNWFLVATLLLGAIFSTPWLKHLLPLPPIRAGLTSAETPVEATRFLLQQRPPGRLFHELGFGSYLIWAASDYPVFVDPRIELYPPEVWRDYMQISAAGEGWEQRLEDYEVNTLMLSPAEQPSLVAAVERSPAWRLEHRDPAAILFVRIPRNG